MNKTSETPECAALPILRLNAGAQINHDGQATRKKRNYKMSGLFQSFHDKPLCLFLCAIIKVEYIF